MVRLVTARYVGGNDTIFPFQKNRTYPLAIKSRRLSKKISVYQRHGYYDAMNPGTLHHFANWDLFNNCWDVIEEEN